MVDAIQSSGGVPGVDVSLSNPAQDPAPSSNIKIAGVSLISNIVYNNGSLTVWTAYGIGPGKCIHLKDLGIPQLVQIPDLVKCDEGTATTMPNAHFIKVKSRRQPCSDNSQQCSDTEEENVTEISPAVHIFSCPEEGCRKFIKDFLLYRTIWTSENTNVLWSMKHSSTEQRLVTQRGYKVSLVV